MYRDCDSFSWSEVVVVVTRCLYLYNIISLDVDIVSCHVGLFVLVMQFMSPSNTVCSPTSVFQPFLCAGTFLAQF